MCAADMPTLGRGRVCFEKSNRFQHRATCSVSVQEKVAVGRMWERCGMAIQSAKGIDKN